MEKNGTLGQKGDLKGTKSTKRSPRGPGSPKGDPNGHSALVEEQARDE